MRPDAARLTLARAGTVLQAQRLRQGLLTLTLEDAAAEALLVLEGTVDAPSPAQRQRQSYNEAVALLEQLDKNPAPPPPISPVVS